MLPLISMLIATAGSGQIVFDVDLTRGNAGSGAVEGGRWDRGWRVVRDGDRIVFDAGRPLEAGVLEVWFTTDRSPVRPKPKSGEEAPKVNWVGLYEHAHLDQNFGRPDLARRGAAFYLRTGNTYGTFSKTKVFAEAKEPCQNKVGDEDDWIADDRTVMSVRLSWRDGIASLVDTRDRSYSCSENEMKQKQTLQRLRYVFLGCDNLQRLSPVGVRFLRVRLTSGGMR